MSISAIKYPSINAKLKGMYAKRLKDDDLQDLAKQNNLKSAVAILKNKSSSLNVLSEDADREQIEKVLNGEIIYDIEKIVPARIFLEISRQYISLKMPLKKSRNI